MTSSGYYVRMRHTSRQSKTVAAMLGFLVIGTFVLFSLRSLQKSLDFTRTNMAFATSLPNVRTESARENINTYRDLNNGIMPIPLTTLTRTYDMNHTCQNTEFVLINDTVLDPSLAYDGGRKIPRIIHITSKSRCVLSPFLQNVNKWKETFPSHSVFFHDDEAVHRLLDRQWPEFPNIAHALQCINSGAAIADLWRSLVLYEYGGMYSDIDSIPAKLNEHTIRDDDEAFFVIERIGVLSQYFMVASPRHPLMYLLVQVTLQRILTLPNVDKQYIPVVTGPGALKQAMIMFMGTHNSLEGKNLTQYETFARVQAGEYVGLHGAKVRAVGKRGGTADHEWVVREAIKQKSRLYEKMGMRHFSRHTSRTSNGESCLHRVYTNLFYVPAQNFTPILW